MSLELVSVSFAWEGAGERARRVALSDASLALEPGRAIALLGPNGAGKSTLLGLASGRLAPISGSALLDGTPLASWDRRALARKLAYLPQVERLPFNYPALDFVLLGRAPHVPALALPAAADYARAKAALEDLGLDALAERPVTELSGGELQLVRLARCLAQGAEYLLLDEPSTMLDPANARRLADALRRLVARGRALLFTTHDAPFAAFAADEAALLKDGSLVALGPAHAVLVPELLEATFGLPFKDASFPTVFHV